MELSNSEVADCLEFLLVNRVSCWCKVGERPVSLRLGSFLVIILFCFAFFFFFFFLTKLQVQ